MSLFHCRFCDHDNPPDARFCNACGSPLYLKPCPQCEAVNDSAALQCYQCGAALTKDDAAQAASGTVVPEFANATESAGEPGGAEHRTASGAFTERFEVEFGEFRPSLFSDTATATTTPVGATSGKAAGDHREMRTSSGVAHHRESVARTTLTSTGALLVLALIVVGAGAYYAYQHSDRPTKSADVVAAAPPDAQQQPAPEVKAPSATSNEAAPPVPTTPEADSTKGAAKAEAATAVPTATRQESVGPSVEPRPGSKVKSTADSRRTGAAGKGSASQPAHPPAPSDASAIATQRIIEREVGIRAVPSPPPTRTP